MELASVSDICDIADIIMDCSIGQDYYPSQAILNNKLKEGIRRKEVWICKDNNIIIGVLWVMKKGMFGSYPYLHIIAVKEGWRFNGVGSKMMKYLHDNIVGTDSDFLLKKLFLLVNTDNKSAIKFYEKFEYMEICEIDSLFRKGKKERLMIKKFFKS